MTQDELFAALEIAPEDTGPIDLDEGPAAPVAPPTSPTALELDEWSIRRGAETLDNQILGPILANLEDRDGAAFTAADCLAAAFEPTPQLAENCADEIRGRFFGQLLETPEYQALHTETRLDPLASELAAGHFAQGYMSLVEQEQEQEQEQKTGQDATGGPPVSAGDQARQNMKKQAQALGAAARALKSASETVEDLREAQRALGEGGQDGGHVMPVSEIKERFERIRNNHELRRILELAGRYRRAAQARQRQKTHHGRDDVVGVTLGADLSALVPSELAALVDEDLELDALRRFLERAMMQRDYRGTEPKSQGPIVVVVDESGSMAGELIATAKAFALAMAWVAKHQHRWILLVGFGRDAEGSWCAMPPGKWDQAALLEWLEHRYGGGTSPAVPLVTLPARWQELGCPEGKTDVILITDALLSVPDDIQRNFIKWKADTNVKYYTLILGESEPGDLAAVSDRVWCLRNLDLEQDAIQEIMAI